MKHLYLFLLFISMSLLYISCCECDPNAAFDKNQIASEITLMTDSFHNAIEQHGFSAEFDFLDASEDFFWVIPGEDKALNYDTIYKIIDSNSKIFNQIKFHWDTLDINVLSPEIATYTGIVGGHMHSITEDTIYDVSIIESGTFIKRANGWKFLCGQSRNN